MTRLTRLAPLRGAGAVDGARAVWRDGDDLIAAFERPGGAGTISLPGGHLQRLEGGGDRIEATGWSAAKKARVVLARHAGEESVALADWVKWTTEVASPDAILVLSQTADVIADSLEQSARDLALPLALAPLLDPNLPDLSVHAALRAWLGDAQGVCLLSVSDLLDPGTGAGLFDRMARRPDRVLPLAGTPVWPWRRRQGRAHLGDHVFRIGDAMPLASWVASPAALGPRTVFGATRIFNAPVLRGDRALFFRAAEVFAPDAASPIAAEKASFRTVPELVDVSTRLFGRVPLAAPKPPSHVPPTDGPITILTTMKDEAPFILDWIAHHRAIGVRRIVVFTNDCADVTPKLLDALAPAGVIRRDNPMTGKTPQHAAFRAAERMEAVAEAGWLLPLDVDEFVNIRCGEGQFSDLITAGGEPDLISMPWRLFGNSDIARFEDRPVTEQFTLAAPEWMPRPFQAWGFKTLYRNAGHFRRIGVHRPKGLMPGMPGLRWIDGNGRPLPPSIWKRGWRMGTSTAGYDLVQIDHYAVRSADSFLVKRERGRVNHVDRDQGLNYWFRMNHNVFEDRSIERFSHAAQKERSRLLALPDVAGLHDEGVEWHRARARALRDDPRHAALYEAITSERLQKLSRLTPRFGAKIFEVGPDALPEDLTDLVEKAGERIVARQSPG